MPTNNSQMINALLIVVGGAFLIFQIATEDKNPYLMIFGLIFLMLGLYRATNHWVVTKDDHKKEDDQDSNKGA